MTRYKVIYHLGEQIGLKTKVTTGMLCLEADRFRIDGPLVQLEVPFAALREVELFRLHGLGRIIRVTYPAGTLFVTVVRFTLGDFFAVIHFFKAGELCERLKAGMHGAPRGTA